MKTIANIMNAKALMVFPVLFCFLMSPLISIAQQASNDYKIKKVVIDAGHGGKDAGAIGYSKLQEKEVTLSVSLKLGAYIKQYFPDIEVIYTRTSDEFIELHERANIANSKDADLFISIHANSASSSSAHGAEAFVLGLHRTDANLEVAKRENAVIELEDDHANHYEFDPTTEAGHIIMSMKQNAHLEQSITLASKVQEQFTERVGRRDRGVKQAGFLVLYKTTMPAILVELGFLSNPDEEKFLRSEKNRDYMASAVFRAFRDYKNEVEGMVDVETLNNAEAANDSNQNKGVEFKIQIAASSKKARERSKIYKDFSVITEEKVASIYKYLEGNYRDYDSAKSSLDRVKAKGYKDAFIVAYKDGKRARLQDVLSNHGQ